MSLTIARAIVASLRVQIASLEMQALALEEALGMDPPQAACSHPDEDREEGNFGQPELCKRCGQTV